MIDYTILRIIWWLLLGVLLIGFAVMDGFDLGIGILLPYVSRTNIERRVLLNTIGSVWEGNQIWLVLGAGAIFAAWPLVYSLVFSGFYFAMLLVLLALILRPVGFKYRSKIDNSTWRTVWDTCLFTAGFVPALLFGVALGNVLEGIPYSFDDSLRLLYTGTLFDLLNPFGLICGLTSVAMLIMHGGNFLAIKTEGVIQDRAKTAVTLGALFYLVLFSLGGYWITHHVAGYAVSSTILTDAPSNPLHKQVSTVIGGWLMNYRLHPYYLTAPVGALGAALLAILFVNIGAYKTAWLSSSICVAGTIATVGLSMFPFIVPSSTNPNMSLLVWDASSSSMTLWVMLISTLIFMPIILVYTSWIYYVLRGKVKADDIEKNSKQSY
jgi:cytochrome d ubiquinol oxidase subunit II